MTEGQGCQRLDCDSAPSWLETRDTALTREGASRARLTRATQACEARSESGSTLVGGPKPDKAQAYSDDLLLPTFDRSRERSPDPGLPGTDRDLRTLGLSFTCSCSRSLPFRVRLSRSDSSLRLLATCECSNLGPPATCNHQALFLRQRTAARDSDSDLTVIGRAGHSLSE